MCVPALRHVSYGYTVHSLLPAISVTNSRNFTLPSTTTQHCVFPRVFTSDPTTGAFSLPQSWHYKKAHCTWAHVSLLTPGLHLSCHDNPAPVLWAPGDPDRLCLQRQFRPRINNRDESQACLFTLFPGPLRLRINSNKMPTTP